METSLQLTMGMFSAHRNQYLFSDHYLDNLLPDDPRWSAALPEAEVRKGKNKRDLAVIQTLLGTGLQISELAALKVPDVEISDRKGKLRVREGKGSKAREIPLDNRTRRALSNYLE